MRRRNHKISYIKKPFAKKSLIAVSLSAAAVFLCFFGLRLSVMAQGKAGLDAGAFGFCSFLVAGFSIGYAVFSFAEKEKNYLPARISIMVDAILILFWIGLTIAAG